MPISRIYVVINGEERRLVDASSAAQAIRHCVKNRYTAKPATPKDIAAFMKAGLSVETASEDGLIPTSTKSASAQSVETTTATN